MKLTTLISHTGIVLKVTGFLLLAPLAASFLFGESPLPYLAGVVVALICGTLLEKRSTGEKINMEAALIISAVAIMAVSLAGSIPYLFYMNPVDAVFESVSGFTTTGLTVTKPESLPMSMLLWRSLTQWIGGLGVLVMVLMLLGSPGLSAYHIYRSEGRYHRIEPSTINSIKRIVKIYGIYTLFGMALLYAAGMPLFDAINHSLTSISTGGFSVKNGSVGAYESPLIYISIMFLMILGATSFFLHDKILRKKIKDYLTNRETRIFWGLTAVSSFVMMFSFLGSSSALLQSVFHAVSAITTTGFSIAEGPYPPSAIFILIFLMLVGGYAGSTAGGIKLVRLEILSNSITWLIRKSSLPPSAVIPVKAGGKPIKKSEITIVALFVLIYLLIAGLLAITLSIAGYPPADSIFLSVSAEGTVGLSTTDISSLPALAKIMIMGSMLLGRLEILPFLVLIYKIMGLKKTFA